MTSEDFNIKFISLKDKVFRFSKRILNNADDAMDVTQDIFEKLWNMRSKLEDLSNPEAFTITSVKNLCFDKIKHNNLKQQKIVDIKYMNQNSFYEQDNFKTETKELIDNLINKLPEQQKMIIHLRDIEGYEFEEMENMLGISVNTIRVNLSRARKKLKEELIKVESYGI